MMKTYQLVIFDWDGTLMNSTGQIIKTVQLSIAQMNLPARSDQQVSHIIGLGLHEALDVLYPELNLGQRKQLASYYQKNWHQQSDDAVLFEHALALIDNLQTRGYLLAVATGKTRPGLDRVLKQTGLTNAFSATRCVDECRSKPDPEMVLQLMHELKVAPDKTVVIGDTSHDLNMAHSAGADSIGISHGAHDINALRSCDPIFIANNLFEVDQRLVSEPSFAMIEA